MTLTLPTPVSSGSGSAGRGLLTTSQPLQQRPPGDAGALDRFVARRKGGCALLPLADNKDRRDAPKSVQIVYNRIRTILLFMRSARHPPSACTDHWFV